MEITSLFDKILKNVLTKLRNVSAKKLISV